MPEELKNGNEDPAKNDSTDEDKTGKQKPKEKEGDDFQRNIEGEEKKPQKKSDDAVPLQKYLDKKSKIKRLENENADLKVKVAGLQSGNNSINSKDLDALAKKFGADPQALKELAAILTPKQNTELEKKIADLEKSNKELLAKDQRREQEKQFEKHFKEKYGNIHELKGKKSLFKQVWFSPSFPELKTLEDIRKAFFPHINAAETKEGAKKESLEAGNGGTTKGSKTIDFKNMTDEQHIEVLKDPELKAKYYKWLDGQS